MSAEQPRRVTRVPVEGVDFLVNHYSVLGISPDASVKDIHASFTKRMKDAHPDTYSGHDQQLKDQLAFKSRVLTNAHDVLTDPERRQQFDEQLGSWKGPVSKDGVPVMAWRSMMRETRGSLEPTLEKARMMSGFDPDMFSLLEEQYHASENPSEALKKAYSQALLRRDIYLSLQEGFLREAVSVEREGDFDVPRNYAAITARKVENARGKMNEEINEVAAMLASGRTLTMLGAGEAQAPNNTQNIDAISAITLYREQQTKQFEDIAQEITRLAGEREAVIRERLTLLTGEYILKQDTLHNKLLIGVQISDDRNDIHWTELQFADTDEHNITASPANTITHEVKAGLTDEKNAQALIDQGYNLVVFPLQEGLSIQDQMLEIAHKHGEAYLHHQGFAVEPMEE